MRVWRAVVRVEISHWWRDSVPSDRSSTMRVDPGSIDALALTLSERDELRLAERDPLMLSDREEERLPERELLALSERLLLRLPDRDSESEEERETEREEETDSLSTVRDGVVV